MLHVHCTRGKLSWLVPTSFSIPTVANFLSCVALSSELGSSCQGNPEMGKWLQEGSSIINKWVNAGTTSSPRHGLCAVVAASFQYRRVCFSPQDTVVALQALSLFAALTVASKTEMDITVTAPSLEMPETFSIDTRNRFLLQTKEVL